MLHKRSAKPDDRVAKLLEDGLQEAGYPVFIDRRARRGEEWAKEVAAKVAAADVVIPLLSAASVESEVLEYQLQIAHEAAQRRYGEPRLLPIRIGYSEPFPRRLEASLGPIRPSTWDGPADDERLVAEILADLRKPASEILPNPRRRLETVGGAVPLESEYYVVRESDDAFRAAIARGDSIVLVKGARQMGKTSLLARGLHQAREAGARVIPTDLQSLNSTHLRSAEAFFMALAEGIADQLDLDVLPDEVWSDRRSPDANFERYLRTEVLETASGAVVWGMDEVDRLFFCDFSGEVFGLFRTWHNKRSLEPGGPWSRLTLVISYATESHLFITDVNQSPFNVGERLELRDFTLEQVADLNGRHGYPLRSREELERFHRLVGHPYLVRRGLLEMASDGTDVDALIEQADRDEGIYGEHLRRLLLLLVKDPNLCDVVREVLQGGACPTKDSFYRLRSAGLLEGETPRTVRLRCGLYETYFERNLLAAVA